MPDSPSGIAAVIVLYNPDANVPGNVRAIAPQVDHVYLVDNSEKPAPGLAETIGAHNLSYVPMGGNMGIAAALNAGLERCGANGYEWALTLDQDSAPSDGMVRELDSCRATCTGAPVGVIAPVHQIRSGPAFELFEGCREELTVMTSGNLLSVSAWKSVGGFDESLFIDQVDHDLCLRFHEAGYAVLTCGTATLSHSMGEMSQRWLLGPVYVSNHTAIRRYYITRNRLWAIRRYGRRFPSFAERERRSMRQELLKIVLFERDKLAKLRMAWRGWRDFRSGRLGPYRDARP